MKSKEELEYICLGHIEPIIDRCTYCIKDNWNLNCECYRAVPQWHYRRIEDETSETNY